MNKMKRIIALLLAASLCLSMAGCYMDEEELKEAAKDAVKDYAEDALKDAADSVKGELEEGFNQAVGEIEGELESHRVTIPNLRVEAGGSKDSESDSWLDFNKCDHKKPGKWFPENNKITCACGEVGFYDILDAYTFIGLVDPDYKKYKKTHKFENISEVDYYSQKYAAYLETTPDRVESKVIAALAEMKEIVITFDANGGYNAPVEQEIAQWKPFPKLTEDIPSKTEYCFLGWGTTPDATEVAFEPGQSMSDQERSMTLYAIWGTCSTHSHALDNEKNEIRCTACSTVYPVDMLRFSSFLKFYYPKKDVQKLKQKDKDAAVAPYIRIKTLMTEKEMQKSSTFTQMAAPAKPDCFQLVGSVASKFSADLKKATLQDTQAFFLMVTTLNIAADKHGVNALPTKISGFAAKANTATSFIEFVAAAKDAEKKADRYESVKKEGGEEYTYFKKENYIDLAFANAKSITTLASFVANFCGLSLGVPLPDVDGILEDVRGLTKDYTLAEVYSGLTDPLGNNVQNMYVNDILKGKGLNTFGPVYSRQHEEIEAAMKNGPCAKDILMLIPEILRYTDNVKGHKEEVASALWYYYGWRLQYDYQVLLSDIYNDRV